MTTYSEFFKNERPSPKWFIGDRVFGYWNKIPFIGTVLNDNMLNEETGPRVNIQVDLPLEYDKKAYNIIQVGQRDLKKLIKY